MKPTCPRVFTVSFGSAALVALVLTFALVTMSCHFFGDPEQYRPKAKETTAAIVTAVPAGGEVANNTPVTLTTATEGASIYYTTDETEPTPAAALYSADNKPVITPDTFILKAIAVKEGLEDSEPVKITYSIEGHAARPTADPAGGAVQYNTPITLETTTAGAAIYYTFGGEEPSLESGTLYKADNKPAIGDTHTILKAIAVHDEMGDSGVLTVSYLLPVATPTAKPVIPGGIPAPEGTVPYGTELELSCTTEGVTIFYTLDGTTPGVSSARYEETEKPILRAGQTLRAIARKDGMATSAELKATPIATDITQFNAWLDDVDGTLAEPAPVSVAMNLGTMTTTTSNWRQLLDALYTKGGYVKLDLSLCTVDKGADDEYTFGHNNYTMANGMNQIVNIVLPSGVTTIEDYAFTGCTNLALAYLPSGVTTIGYQAFNGCTSLALTSLPSGVTTIGGWAFSGCTNLALISLPNGVTSIGSSAFSGCTKLALTSLPNGVTSIGSSAFSGCTNLALTSLPSGVTIIGDYAFDGCTKLALTSLPNGVTFIGGSAFDGCTDLALTSLPNGVTIIWDSAFRNCTNLALTSLPSSVTTIEDYAFDGCTNLALTSLPNGITAIGNVAFSGCTSLAFVSLPEGFTFLNIRAFEGCTSLTRITLPDGLTNINMFAFYGCTNLSNITIHAVTPPSLSSTAFDNTNPDLRIYVPAGSVDAYKATGNWSEHADRIHPIE